MKTNAIFPILLASAVLFSCGRKNKVEKEVVVYHDAACDIDTTNMAGHNLIGSDAAIVAHHTNRNQGTAAGTSGSTTRSESYYTKGTTVSKPQGAGAASYKRPADPTDPEVGMDDYDNRHTTIQQSKAPAKPGVTGTGATQASGTGTSAGRPIN